MAKQISKQINSNYLPTFVGGFPVYGCGGRMKYATGGAINPYSTAGNMLGNTVEQVGQGVNPGGANYGASIGGGALKGACTGALIGSVVP